MKSFVSYRRDRPRPVSTDSFMDGRGGLRRHDMQRERSPSLERHDGAGALHGPLHAPELSFERIFGARPESQGSRQVAARQPAPAPREAGGFGADGDALVGMRLQAQAVVLETPVLKGCAVAFFEGELRAVSGGSRGDAKPVFGHPEHALPHGGGVELPIEVPDALLAGVHDEGGGGPHAVAVAGNVDAVKPRLIQGIKRFNKNDISPGGLRLIWRKNESRKNRQTDHRRTPTDTPNHLCPPYREAGGGKSARLIDFVFRDAFTQGERCQWWRSNPIEEGLLKKPNARGFAFGVGGQVATLGRSQERPTTAGGVLFSGPTTNSVIVRHSGESRNPFADAGE